MESITKELTKVKYSAAAVKTLHFYIEPNSSCFRMHWHDQLEIIRVKRGSMTVLFGGSSDCLKQGEMSVFLPRTVHKGYTTDSFVEYDVIMFDVRSFYNESAVCRNKLPQIYNGNAKFETIISKGETLRCADEICAAEDSDSLKMTSLVYELLYLLFKYHLTELHTELKSSVMKIIDYMEENFALDLNTETRCRKFSYSTGHFCRKFKRATGVTPMTYLKIYRLEQALQKLKEGNQSIGEIAALCGYSDANYFTRCFKAHYGVPPRYYKK
ncbi:MAG: helix-turn-helix domain-containing protein [Clostridia bacterium]|nr:helix-turn-helix domain-containing protein [Clostridia bacterium]